MIKWCSAKRASMDPQRQDGGLQMLLLPPSFPSASILARFAPHQKDGQAAQHLAQRQAAPGSPNPPSPIFSPHPHSLEPWIMATHPKALAALAAGTER